MSEVKEHTETESHSPIFELVDEHKEFAFNNACPYCKCKLTYTVEGWEEDDNCQWMADSITSECSSEPDMEKEDEWEEWFSIHSQMPYVHQLPVDTKVKNWINSKYRFKLD